MRKKQLRAGIVALAATALAVGGPAGADLLVDTGPGGTSSIGAPVMFHNGGSFQFLAGKFTLAQPASLDSLEAWMGPFSNGGDIEVSIRADGTLPGDPIFSQSYTLPFRLSAGWDAFADYEVSLPAGTYWLSFEPIAGTGMNRSMPTGAPSPLASYAYLADGNPGWIVFAPNPGLGIRVYGTPEAAAPLGTASRTIVVRGPDFPNGLDRLLGDGGESETLNWNIDLSGYGWSSGVGVIFANGLQAGAAAVCANANNAARSVAYRSFENTTAGPLTFRVNGVLDGEFDDGFGSTNLAATAGIHALDSAMFDATILASGLGPAEFLLGGDALDATGGAEDRLNLALLFPPAARLASDVEEIPFQTGQLAVPLQTGLFTVDPGQVFTLLFDVSALASGSGNGGTLFYNTLAPAADLFTDSGGGPVSGIEPLGTAVVIGEVPALMWGAGGKNTLTWQTAVGASSYRLYRGDGTDLLGLVDATADSCVVLEGAVTTSGPILTDNPLSGEFFWYLATGLDGSNEGSAGKAKGAQRVVNASGSCP